ncbi:MAG: hypothetical protein K6T63_02285 [Alicyclobacillus herbarius]|uniref:ATP-dependent DNA ligase n=1 Tax=Alicyclobacillus herbarius TaxID=122960 RepID=UPI00041CF296|nr:hypothetical protein [Alicyclobacillus herbarius]MCL6631437.1 hypothetical protein [Alicyclobacillus herbarius]
MDSLFGLRPMEPILKPAPNQGPEFHFQVKWDGVRLLMERQGDAIRLWNRKGRDRTKTYPELVNWALAQLTEFFVLDGEVISLGTNGKPQFRQVLRRDLAHRPRTDIPIVYVVFDCLSVRGTSLFDQGFEVRQEQLRQVVSQSGLVQVSDNFSDGNALYERMQELGMEGIVAKRAGSYYYPGEKRAEWQKVKCWRYITLDGLYLVTRDGRPASVVVGERPDLSHPAGAVATGIDKKDWVKLAACSASPEPHRPDWRALPPGIRFVIRYLEWTDTAMLRHPVVVRIEWP